MTRLPAFLADLLRRTPEQQRLLPLTERGVEAARLASVCREARCPNRKECYARGEMTFLILGKVCTRGCPFCGISAGTPVPPDPDEPRRLAAAVASLPLSRVVITSVTRDDLPDGGASHFAACHEALSLIGRPLEIELLLPDFGGDPAAPAVATSFHPSVAGHNIETVPRLYPSLRPGGDYRRSLGLLEQLSTMGLRVASSLMVGLGEHPGEVVAAMKDLRLAGCTRIVIGQYLPPTPRHHRVADYVTPETFDDYRREGYSLGFEAVMAGSLARSSLSQAGAG